MFCTGLFVCFHKEQLTTVCLQHDVPNSVLTYATHTHLNHNIVTRPRLQSNAILTNDQIFIGVNSNGTPSTSKNLVFPHFCCTWELNEL